MSVWKHPFYRDGPLQWALRTVPAACRNGAFFHSFVDFEIEEFGDYVCPDGIKPGNLLEQYRANPKVLDGISTNTYAKVNHHATSVFNELPRARHGIDAVYAVAAIILGQAEAPRKELKGAKAEEFFQETYKHGIAASNHSKQDGDEQVKVILEAQKGQLQAAREYLRDLIRFRGFHRARSYKRAISLARAAGEAYPEVERRDAGRFGSYRLFVFQGCTIIVKGSGLECYALLGNDVERVERVVEGVRQARVYGGLYGVLDTASRRRLLGSIKRMEDFMVSVMRGNVGKRSNEVCVAFDVGYGLYTALYLASDDPRAKLEQQKKWEEKNLGEIMDYRAYHACVSGLPPKEAMEVLLMYKALPQPDYDYFGAAYRQEEMYKENRQAAEDDGAAKGPIFDEVITYHKWLMVKAFYAKHQKCPGFIREGMSDKRWHRNYPYVDPRAIPAEEALDIDFNGEFVYMERGIDNLDLVKDKAICPKSIDKVKDIRDIQKMPVANKNYLMDVLTRDIPIDTRTVLNKLVKGTLDLDIRVDDKAEAKKDVQRWFMEANSEARMALSIYEESITEYAVHVPGFFHGKSHSDKVATMNRITKPITAAVPIDPLFINFDIKKFSPYLLSIVHKALDAQWAEAFGLPALNHMSDYICKGKVHYVKGCIHHSFDKLGVDFEGFFGKKLTMYHCAVMGATVRRLKKKKILNTPGRFAAFVDDGLLRVDLPRDRYTEQKAKVIGEVEKVYAKCALRISWDKTYVSKHYATFLHEVRIHGRSITAGLRAALKMTSRADEPVDSLAADLSACSATAAGAVQAGAPLMAVFGLYHINVAEAMNRWYKEDKKFKKSEALWMYAPINLGGFGLESMTSLSGSLKGPTLVESMGHMELINIRYPETITATNRILAQETRHASNHSSIINPANLVTKSNKLRSDRFRQLVERSLIMKVRSPVMAALLGNSLNNDPGFVELALAAGSVIPVPLRKILDKMEKGEVIRKLARKFLTARSALVFCSKRAIFRVGLKNRSEAEQVLKKLY